MDAKVAKPKIVPFSLKDAPSLIERLFPAQKISVETQKERKAGQGQTLTGLGSYWKGRKPLLLVEACVLGALLPSTGDDEEDLSVFEMLLGMSDEQITDRMKTGLTVDDIVSFATPQQLDSLTEEAAGETGSVRKIRKLPAQTRDKLFADILAKMPYDQRVSKLSRPEEVSRSTLIEDRLQRANRHLGTTANTMVELVEQLGIMRFGHRPKLSDTFSGGGSIPFAAARLGCDVVASDLNPIAAMLTWGALNVVGGDEARRSEIALGQERLAGEVRATIDALGVERDKDGNLAKAYMYCLETRCPQTGWLVPLLPNFIISKKLRVIVGIVPDRKKRRFDFVIEEGVSAEKLKAAELGTVVNGDLSYELDGERYSSSLKTIRGDKAVSGSSFANSLRPWTRHEIEPRSDDIFQERLYCIQWITRETVDATRQRTFFAAPGPADLDRERRVSQFVSDHIVEWQKDGILPDMAIEKGEKTDEPIRTRGWTHWHHLFPPRHLLILALIKQRIAESALCLDFCQMLNITSKLCRINSSEGQGGAVKYGEVFYNQALNTFWNYGVRASTSVLKSGRLDPPHFPLEGRGEIKSGPAKEAAESADLFITDPPYADAVNYHEITEYFIAWLRKSPPKPFDRWLWDSRRPLAIQGDGDEFRHNMVEAYGAMTNRMPDNGLQIVMFTHQSASVWADMAQIFWGAGLQVVAAWYIATETTSELKKGGYVQGTVLLVLRKRSLNESGYKDEIVQEVKAEVADQIDTMIGLNQRLKGHGRAENLFEDADLQMAGYAAALRVLTKYEKIDGTDMSKEALRPRRAGEKNLVGEIIDFAVQVANEHMVPEYMAAKLWEGLTGAERFYLKMMDIETTSLRKLDNYQNFAKAFRVDGYDKLMGLMEPNKARLKTAKEFKKNGFELPEFGQSVTRAALYGILELENDVEGDDVLSHLKDLLPNYHNKRDDLAAIAEYIARKREDVDQTESRAARILHGLIRNERLG
jgi:putative DNA methylase